MRCPKCGTEGLPSKQFCAECGSPLPTRCRKCGAETPADAKFCADCGAKLTEAASPKGSEVTPIAVSSAGERRHLTVLFCDLVGSTEIAARLDPEEWREIVASYHRAAAEAITQFGGYVAHYLGDGVMAYFGWPKTHENAAERAARAGLTILESISQVNEKPILAKLAARVGIHSGVVVVGAGAGKEADVFGDVPSIASRVQALAEPGTLLVTGATYRLVSGLFEVEELGARLLKGIEDPVQVCQVIQTGGRRGLLSAGPPLTPFTGREDELCLLLSRWERVRQGDGQVVMVVGEPGIGKSRLIHQFHERIARDRHIWIESAGDPFAQSTPFHAVAEMLRQGIGARGTENAEQSIERLLLSLERVGLRPKQVLPLIAPLLKLPVPKNYPPVPAAPEEQRRQLLASLSRWAMGIAEAQPVIMALEDLQWADASTIEFAKLVAEQSAKAPLMQIFTTRSGFDSPWEARPHYAQLALDRLSDREAREMVESVGSEKRLSPEMVATVVQRATGVPLFVEELTRDSIERGKRSTPSEIPATLHDSLMARLDRRGPARELAQIGAVIGREFSHELLRLIANLSDRQLQLALDDLVDADLLHVARNEPDKSYKFKHALVQDAAYNILLKSRRRELHQRIAQILEKQSAELSAPELLAHHYTEAGLIAEAVRYWRRAGRKAIERSANAEAVVQLRRGLELLKTLPPNSERVMEEVNLQIALTTPLIATGGYTVPEVEKASRRALDLCQQLGETPQLFVALGSLYSIYFNRGELQIAVELARHMLRLAEALRDPALLLWGHYSLGFALTLEGSWNLARDHLTRSIALYDPGRAGNYGFVQDPGPTATAMLSHVFYSLGYPDQALEKMREAVAQARNLSHPFTLVWVLDSAAVLHWGRGEKSAAHELRQEEAALSIEQGFKSFFASASKWLGFAEVEEGRVVEGLSKIHNAVGNVGYALDQLDAIGLIALAEGKAGQLDRGLARIEEALKMLSKRPIYWASFQLNMIKGRLLLLKSPTGFRKAKQCFHTAIEIARRHNAKGDELRAAMSLANILAKQGHRSQARTMLAEIYEWFTEGFDTADLKEAKALLDELSA
jgi:class 3 adenylate cyclase/tetratricopeptide (TPR) repeat protein